MATIATSQATLIIDPNSELAIGGPYEQEIWRIASGAGVTGDTIVVTPLRIKRIYTAVGPVANALSASGASNVTLTLLVGTATTSAFDVTITGIVN